MRSADCSAATVSATLLQALQRFPHSGRPAGASATRRQPPRILQARPRCRPRPRVDCRRRSGAGLARFRSRWSARIYRNHRGELTPTPSRAPRPCPIRRAVRPARSRGMCRLEAAVDLPVGGDVRRRSSSSRPRGPRGTPRRAPSFRAPAAARPARPARSAWNCISRLFAGRAAVDAQLRQRDAGVLLHRARARRRSGTRSTRARRARCARAVAPRVRPKIAPRA